MPERKLDIWPDEVIQLNRELASGLHPKLEANLSQIPDADFAERFSRIATYCDIVMDGMYEVETLCQVIKNEILPRLERRRENPNKTIILN